MAAEGPAGTPSAAPEGRRHGDRFAVVLVRPQEEGNVGAVARAMANMGLESLVLVEPAPRLGRVARAFAVGAADILERARRVADLPEALAGANRVIGTTSARSRELGVPLLAPRDLPALLASDPAGTKTALVFGPEPSGLNNDELAVCSALVRIPAAPRQPTLNLAQAVLILAYELFLAELAPSADPDIEPAAPTSQVDGLFEQVAPLLSEIGFERDDTFETVLRDLRRLAARSALSEREVRILRGICRRAGHALAHGGQ